MDWRLEAICRDEDPELFFPIGTTGPSLAQIEQAKNVCRRCPVREPCLQAGIEGGETGIWGGTTSTDRGGKEECQEPAKLQDTPTQALKSDSGHDHGNEIFPVSASQEELDRLVDELTW